jgi:hypothetical protein
MPLLRSGGEPDAHAASHENAGSDEIDVTDLSGLLADAQTPTAHNLLSASHGDTSADTVSRGSIITGNSTPAWDELVIGTAGKKLRSDGTDAAWEWEKAVTITGDTTLTDDHETVFVDVDGATPVTVTFPAASGRAGKSYTVIPLSYAPVNVRTTGSDLLDNCIVNATQPFRISHGAMGRKFICDGVGWYSMPGQFEPAKAVQIYDDFLSNSNVGATGLGATVSGAGAAVTPSPFAGSYFGLDCGTTTTGRACSHHHPNAYYATAGVWQIFQTQVLITVLSTLAERFTFYVGMGDTTGAGDMVDGVYFRYSDSLSAGDWEICTSSNSVRTQTDTNIAVTTAVTKLRIVIDGDTSTAYFWIDYVYAGSINTNMPTTSARTYAPYLAKIEKSLGTTNRSAYVDFFDWTVLVTNAGR